jgi:hypothetical protein
MGIDIFIFGIDRFLDDTSELWAFFRKDIRRKTHCITRA